MKQHLLLIVLLGCTASIGTSQETEDAKALYLRHIKPMLRNKCYACHGAIKQEAGLRLDTGEAMRIGGDSGSVTEWDSSIEESLLMERVSSEDLDVRMPPEGEGLTTQQQDWIGKWLTDRAPSPAEESPQQDPKLHWAFQPIADTVPPPGPAQHPIDRFIDAKLEHASIEPATRASSLTLVRRMFLDLHGLPPSPSQMNSWIDHIDNPQGDRGDAIAELIDWLLASPRYGERWAQHWLDIVRYADTHGFEVNTPRPNAWPYRDYVIDAFNADKPYDHFVRDQLAGDSVGEGDATGFLVAAAALLPGQIGADAASKRLARQDSLDEIVVGTSATFMGMTIGCARCHDHKFDPISQRDYYGLQAFFAGVLYGDREVRDADYQRRVAQADRLLPRIKELRDQLSRVSASAFVGRTIIIDDEDLDHVTLLRKKKGHGANPKGTKRGYAQDIGDISRMPNLSKGRYTWWENSPGADTFTWNPQTSGRFQLWISWGAHGSGVHTHDARYVLDRDGNLATRADQKEIASVDQYYHAGVSTGSTEQVPMWSGLQNAGVHDFDADSKIILRCGESERGISADVIVMQEILGSASEQNGRGRPLPILRDPVSPKLNIERFPPIWARYVRWTSHETLDNNLHEPCIDELEVFAADDSSTNIALASGGTVPTSSGNYANSGKHQLKHINDGNVGNSKSWISNQKGEGWVQLEFPKPYEINRIQWGRDRTEKFRDRLGIRYTLAVSTDGKHWTTVATHRDRMTSTVPNNSQTTLIRNAALAGGNNISAEATELNQLENQRKDSMQPRMVFAGKFKSPEATHLLNRGDPEQPEDDVAPAPPAVFQQVSLRLPTPAESSDQARRRALADWLVAENNPLTARVMVNRIWQYHFGRALVDTPSDFGLRSAPPSHPQLLDWLSTEFRKRGWSIKAMHRLIMSSEAYQRSHSIQEKAIKVDAASRLLWRFPSRRLEGEAIRDSILAVSGQLNLSMHGPGYSFFKSRGGLSGFPHIEQFGAAELRRMIYSHKIRMEPVPVFGAFDCPDAGQPMPQRSQSTTPLQALNLFNSTFVLDQSDAFAERLRRLAPGDMKGQISQAFRIALGRQPSDSELRVCGEVAKEHNVNVICRVLFNSNEFLFLP